MCSAVSSGQYSRNEQRRADLRNQSRGRAVAVAPRAIAGSDSGRKERTRATTKNVATSYVGYDSFSFLVHKKIRRGCSLPPVSRLRASNRVSRRLPLQVNLGSRGGVMEPVT